MPYPDYQAESQRMMLRTLRTRRERDMQFAENIFALWQEEHRWQLPCDARPEDFDAQMAEILALKESIAELDKKLIALGEFPRPMGVRRAEGLS